MTDQHPITPPPELVMQWVSLACEYEGNETWIDLATHAARWGADQELWACVKWMKTHLHSGSNLSKQLRTARRPKPPSLAEEALVACERSAFGIPGDRDTIRRALERLQELEKGNE